MLQEDPPLVLQPDPDAPMSPPLWPRRPFREAAQDITNLPINVKAFEKTMADIPLLDLEEPTSDELRQENLAIVGGWRMYNAYMTMPRSRLYSFRCLCAPIVPFLPFKRLLPRLRYV
jgi:hypothetical protein